MFDRWFESFTAAAAAVIYLGYEIDRRQERLRDMFFCTRSRFRRDGRAPRRAGVRGVIRSYRATATGLSASA
jgi:hypothetical protein